MQSFSGFADRTGKVGETALSNLSGWGPELCVRVGEKLYGLRQGKQQQEMLLL